MAQRKPPSQLLFLYAVRERREPVWSPRADVYRGPEGWVVKIELAGMRRDDLAIRGRGRELVVAGRRRDVLVERGYAHQHMEIPYSSFERTIELPCDVERCRIETDYSDGMLLIFVGVES